MPKSGTHGKEFFKQQNSELISDVTKDFLTKPENNTIINLKDDKTLHLNLNLNCKSDSDSDSDSDMFADSPVDKLDSSETKPKAKKIEMLDNWDDADGYYKVIIGELLDNRYQVQSILGKGMFASVIRAVDITKEKDKLVAIKVIRNNEVMMKEGLKEISVLQKLNNSDPKDEKHVIRLIRNFDHKNHLCLVFENLYLNLRDVLKIYGRGIGINIKAVKQYSIQIFKALYLFQKCGIIHADLKPDNILINEAKTRLKVSDLGSATSIEELIVTPYMVSRFYRAPELILGATYNYAIDIWSIGCTLFELYTGEILFSGRSNNDMLRVIMEIRGKFGTKLLKSGTLTAEHFNTRSKMYEFLYQTVDKVTGNGFVKQIQFIQKPVLGKDIRSLVKAHFNSDYNSEDLRTIDLFIDLLDRCLITNPEKRITALDALNHPFLK